MPVREAFRSFFLLDTLKTAFTMTNSFHRLTKLGVFFQKSRLFFSLFLKRQVAPPLHYLRPIVTQEMHTSH